MEIEEINKKIAELLHSRLNLINGELLSSEELQKEVEGAAKEITDKVFKQTSSRPTIKGWVARDGNGDAYLYPYYRPTRDKRMWFGMTGVFLKCDPIPSLRWEDEPKPVRVIIEEIKD